MDASDLESIANEFNGRAAVCRNTSVVAVFTARHRHALAMRILFVHLSVCPSVERVH